MLRGSREQVVQSAVSIQSQILAGLGSFGGDGNNFLRGQSRRADARAALLGTMVSRCIVRHTQRTREGVRAHVRPAIKGYSCTKKNPKINKQNQNRQQQQPAAGAVRRRFFFFFLNFIIIIPWASWFGSGCSGKRLAPLGSCTGMKLRDWRRDKGSGRGRGWWWWWWWAPRGGVT